MEEGAQQEVILVSQVRGYAVLNSRDGKGDKRVSEIDGLLKGWVWAVRKMQSQGNAQIFASGWVVAFIETGETQEKAFKLKPYTKAVGQIIMLLEFVFCPILK